MSATLDDELADLRRANAELQQRLDEAQAREAATAEVLQVINSSPGDLAPVFEAILEKAHNLCGATYGGLMIGDGEGFRVVAAHGEPSFVAIWRETGLIPSREGSPLGRLMGGERIVHLADASADENYRAGPPATQRLIDAGPVRTLLMVPLRKENEMLGVITAFRQEVRPFTDKQISLLENFAAQAVIAMENARLLSETREALEQQTATAEVLQVINSSPGDLTPVFDAMLERVLRLCEAKCGNLTTYDGESFHFAAVAGHPEFDKWARENGPGRPGPGTTMDRMIRGEQVIHVADIADDEVIGRGSPCAVRWWRLGVSAPSRGLPYGKMAPSWVSFTFTAKRFDHSAISRSRYCRTSRRRRSSRWRMRGS
jgi:hypothetical protein